MTFIRSLLVWGLFIVAESLNGAIRNLIQTLADRPAHLTAFVTGSILILTIATLCIRWVKARSLVWAGNDCMCYPSS
jgi:hypothetical protein